MKKITLVLLGFIQAFCVGVKADEGMWLLPLIQKLNMEDMQELGIELTADDIYSINNSSIKDAIVIFGGGCTGVIVSDSGLLFTNHHCGYDQIQEHSSLDHDYLQDGFWAQSLKEELPNPDLEVRFLDRIENVTSRIFSELSDTLTEEERISKIQEIIDEIETDAAGDNYEARVRSFYSGNEYYLFVYTVYKDVRFVGAPPSSIGKFGYDTDNWEWPRHTGDFSIFRVYTAPDGSPAEYSEDNIPLKPKFFIPVALDGVKEDDFTFILGYPGNTDRYVCSYGIREIMEVENSNRIKIRGQRLELLMKDMESNPAVKIQYASKYSRSSNYWKYSIGQNYRLRVLDVIEKKQEEEAEFQQWVHSDSARTLKYSNILPELEQIYRSRRDDEMNLNAIVESFFIASEIVGFITDFNYLYKMLKMKESDLDEQQDEISQLKKRTWDFFKDYNVSTDIRVTKAMFVLYQQLVRPDQYPDIYLEINKKYKGDINKFVDNLFANTFFSNYRQVMTFLEDPSAKVLEKDKGFEVTMSIFKKYLEEYAVLDGFDVKLGKLNRQYMQARMEMSPEKFHYPDANFTMRMTYGSVKNYSPRDAVHYDEITFLKGVFEKEDSTNFEFVVPSLLKKLYMNQDYGPYGMDGKMPVCFITNNDITGGNSGSPVLNARGELIGLAFDGNWEAMSGDMAYEPNLQRCICVDIRYILFIIDKYAGDERLINELKIIN
jgi:hypothetical protein